MTDKINIILSEWDPIGVGYPLSLDEYKQYAPEVESHLGNHDKMVACLIEILDRMGLEYEPSNQAQRAELNAVVEKLSQLNRA